MLTRKQCLICCTAGVLLTGITGLSFQPMSLAEPSDSIPRHLQLLRAVRQAKQQGLKEVRLPPAILEPTGVETMNEVLRDYAIFRFEVAEMVTLPEDASLSTLYKIRVIETIRSQPRVDVMDLPKGFLNCCHWQLTRRSASTLAGKPNLKASVWCRARRNLV